ncbi:hypothetical protein BESB_071560 [Besnoitia besnoiti]|uniref:Uncharacterized protein n=1 Tax=Besnoitia besnoiti TaxID=94643 RepID=A0A2A9M9X8_BESBE|nr:uncharacterized protein BESB_071560 [Besnoitia besnoiti]PFH34004.1 hypothetical protein BESB_071560 [Besnoitia besnoiti]
MYRLPVAAPLGVYGAPGVPVPYSPAPYGAPAAAAHPGAYPPGTALEAWGGDLLLRHIHALEPTVAATADAMCGAEAGGRIPLLESRARTASEAHRRLGPPVCRPRRKTRSSWVA